MNHPVMVNTFTERRYWHCGKWVSQTVSHSVSELLH